MKKIFTPEKFSLIGTTREELYRLKEEGKLQFRESKLIPTYKVGDELGLASVFLSALKLIKEYREKVFDDIGLKKSRDTDYFTEISFGEKTLKDNRFDGLIVSYSKGIIKDAIFLEFKGKNCKINPSQIEKYIHFTSKYFKVHKFVTVSEEYVSSPLQLPFQLTKIPKGYQLFHLSWSYLKMIAHLLLQNNDHSIEDSDQVKLMYEVLDYLESDTIGLSSFNRLSPNWKAVVNSIKAGAIPNKEELFDVVQNWFELENDIAFKLSRHLGVLVSSSGAKQSRSLIERSERITKHFAKSNEVEFSLKIKQLSNDIRVKANFLSEVIEIDYPVVPPLDRGNKSKVTWLINQFERAEKSEPDLYSKYLNDIIIDVDLKYLSRPEVIKYQHIYTMIDQIPKEREITMFHLKVVLQLGASFKSSQKFIILLEEAIFNHYKLFVEMFKSWIPPAPKFKEVESD